jgi:hypothetical protein
MDDATVLQAEADNLIAEIKKIEDLLGVILKKHGCMTMDDLREKSADMDADVATAEDLDTNLTNLDEKYCEIEELLP